MNKTLSTLLISASCIAARAQGTVLFENYNPPGINAPVYQSDRVTPLSGPQYQAELLGGPSVANLAPVATTGFLTGVGAGYFNDGGQSINTVLPGAEAWVQVNVWNTASGASFDQAKASGLPNSWWHSSIFSVFTGGGGAGVPASPAPLTGLGDSPVYLNGAVPERPQLSMVRSAANVILTWPTNFPGFTLQSATNLTSPLWTTNLPAPVMVNGLNTVTNPISGTQQFYRLTQ